MFGGNSSTTAPILILLVMNILGRTFACQETEYYTGGRCCRLCPAGSRVKYGCTKFTNTTCTSCTEGTYTDQPNRKLKCSDCTNCDADSGLKSKTLCTTTSDTVCEPLEGFHCVDSTDRGCRAAEKHSSCRPGQFISQKGTVLSDSVCSNCADGTFSNGTLTSCQPHTNCESKSLRLIKPGTNSTDAECGENNSKWTRSGIVVSILFVLVIGVSAYIYSVIKKKCCHRECFITETGTDAELRTISNGTPNSISHLTPTPTVHTGDDDGHHNNEHEQTNGLVNGLVNSTASDKYSQHVLNIDG